MKIPAEFAPRSWEMPPGFVVLEESASVVTREFDGEKLDWLVALVQIPHSEYSVLWARPLDERFDAGFVISQPKSHMVTALKVDHKHNLARTLSFVLENERDVGSLARQFFLNENGSLRRESEVAKETIAIASDGVAAWNPSAINGQCPNAIGFEWGEPMSSREFLCLPSIKLWDAFLPQLNDVNSDASFARRFASMKEENRRTLIFGELKGIEEKIHSLLVTRLLSEEVSNETHQGDVLIICVDITNTGEVIGSSFYQNYSVVSPQLEEDITKILSSLLPIKKMLRREVALSIGSVCMGHALKSIFLIQQRTNNSKPNFAGENG